MSLDRFRRRVAHEAARLIYTREETQYARAKMRAVRHIAAVDVKPDDLPGNREIRRHLLALEQAGVDPREAIAQRGEEDPALVGPTATCRVTADRFRTYELLLLPLENVTQPREQHPEGDVLYHSLQVFALARDAAAYDEEFLLAALLHDVGKAIDRRNHVAAGLEALSGAVSLRTAWLIEHHVEALAFREGSLGLRSRRRLEASDDFDELMLLADCDWRGRAVGAQVPDVHDALAYLQALAAVLDET